MTCTYTDTYTWKFTDATIYVGGLDDKVTESLMWELFVQSGPVGKQIYMLHIDSEMYVHF